MEAAIATTTKQPTAAQRARRDERQLRAILQDYRARIIQTHLSGRRLPRETCARQTFLKLYREHGEAHVRDVLTVILESEGNELALIAPVIKAVSALLLAHAPW